MNYISTRDSNHTVSAAEAIFRGIAPDGGLYIPEALPRLEEAFLERLCGMSYTQRAKELLKLFLSDYTPTQISDCVDAAYDSGFDDNRPAPLSSLTGSSYFLELWHGPTCAFKDMALQLLPELLTAAMEKVGGGREAVILVATSGDTGKAALEGFRDVPHTKIMVFYPQHGVSAMQQRQMCTQQGDNLQVTAISGNFDHAQNGVKALFGDEALRSALTQHGFVLSSANSINWGRLLPQIVYYVSAYCDLVEDEELAMGDPVNFCVPTGNFGNILAAHYARSMGLPIKMLVCASNENNVLTELMDTGIYNRNRPFHTTISPSMDILISSNFERLLFELCGSSDVQVRSLMESLKEKGSFTLPPAAKALLNQGFWGGCCDDAATKDTIGMLFRQYSYLCDPHTAVAAQVAEQYKAQTHDDTPMVIVSTASPYKFADSVLDALGAACPEEDFARVKLLEQLTGTAIPQPIAALAAAEYRFHQTCQPEAMAAALKDFLKL